MARKRIARVAEDGGATYRPRRLRHVAGLTAALLAIEVAVQPFLIIHLLGERADDFAVWSERLRDQRVARRAQLTLADVRPFGLDEAGDRAHDRLTTGVDRVTTEDQARAIGGCWLDQELAIEALARAETLARDLVTDGARDPVRCQPMQGRPLLASHRQVRQDLTLAACRAGNLRGHRHVARSAFVLNRPAVHRVINRLAPHGSLPVRIPG